MQNGDISEAEGFFRKVAETGEPATEGFPGSRHLGLIQPADGEECAAQLAVTAAGSGKNSLAYAVHMHWTVAAGLASQVQAWRDTARGMLDTVAESTLARFGHQATVNHLLRSTPKLRLAQEQVPAWVTFALYENAYKDF